MTYQDWCKHSKVILAQAEEYNKWRKEAKKHLLTVIAPKIAALDSTGYMGCGFHYSLEQSLGRLIVDLAIAWQPCANWCRKIEDDMSMHMVYEVCYDSLLEQVDKAEKSVPQYKKACKL